MRLTTDWLAVLRRDQKAHRQANAQARKAQAIFEASAVEAFGSVEASPETHVVCFDCGRLYSAALKKQQCECLATAVKST